MKSYSNKISSFHYLDVQSLICHCCVWLCNVLLFVSVVGVFFWGGGVYCFLFGFCQCTCISFQFHMSPFHWFMCMYISARGNKVRLYRINSINVNKKYWYKNTRKTYLIWVFTFTDWQLVNANGEYIYICELSTITFTTTRKYTEIMIAYVYILLKYTEIMIAYMYILLKYTDYDSVHVHTTQIYRDYDSVHVHTTQIYRLW